MHILFPVGRSSEVDDSFGIELAAAREAGFGVETYDHAKAVRGEVDGAIASVGADGGPLLLRGWMLTPERYAALEQGLSDRGRRLAVTAEQYAEAHYLPNAYRHLVGHTAESVWVEGRDPDDAWRIYEPFRDGDALLKDFAKSAKTRWREACFLPAGTDRERFGEIHAAFLAARGSLFQRGAVIRKFLPLCWQGRDLRGFPVAREYRLFFWRGELLMPVSSRIDDLEAMLSTWRAIAQRFATPFLSMDVAPLTDGGWTVVEVGDGGVSGIPLGYSEERFYRALRELEY